MAAVNPRHTLCRHPPQRWPGMAWNPGPACSGISGRHAPESAVEFAINGYAAIDIARQFLPEIVFLDLGLPGMDGFEVARRLKRELGDIRIVAVTAYGGEKDRERSLSAGCELHLVKPVDPLLIARLLG